MKSYPSYKDSGVEWVGEIPMEWVVSKLKYDSLTPVRYGINISGDRYIEEGIRFIRITDLNDSGVLNPRKGKYLIDSDVDKEFLLDKYDVLFCRSGHTVGKSYLHLEEGKYTSGGYLVRFNFGNHYQSKFIFYISKSHFYEYWVRLNTITSTIENVNGEKYSNMEYPKPPLLEQQQIVTHLDQKTKQIDDLIEKTKQKIKLLKENRTSLINHCVTKGLDPNVEMKDSGVKWVGEIPRGWKTGGLTKFIESIADYRERTPLKTEEGIFLLTAKNIRNGVIDYNRSMEFTTKKEQEKLLSRGKPEIGDVVFTTEAPLGQVANIDRTDIAIAQRIVKFRSKKELLNNFFLKYQILSDGFQQNLCTFSTGSTAGGIKASKFGLLYLTIPSLPEQQQIVTHLDNETQKIGTLIEKENKRIELLKEYRQSLISEVVTGKIDVRGEVLQ